MRIPASAESLSVGAVAAATLVASLMWSSVASAQLVSQLTPPGPPQRSNYCAADQAPAFMSGFATLKQQLGDRMGEPTECPHADPLGRNIRQMTSTGVAVYLADTNTPTFSGDFEHWALTDEGLLNWSGPSEAPPPYREPGTLLFQAGWSADPEERAAPGSVSWKTTSGMLINHGDVGRFDRVEVSQPMGRAAAIEAEMLVDSTTGAFGLWRQRQNGTYRLGYAAGKLFIASDRTTDGFAPAPVLLPRALVSADFDPGSDWHTYRFEATRSHFRALVDGVPLLELEDDRFTGEIGHGVWTDAAAVELRDYRLLEL